MSTAIRARRIGARPVAALVIALAALTGAAGPVAAATVPNYSPVVRCLYADVSTPDDEWVWLMQMRRIEVRPPTVFAAQPGKQFVGWRFRVERQISQEGWSVTYRSPIQIGIASPKSPAPFWLMGIDVKIPQRVLDGYLSLDYRVVLTVIWYNGDGSKQTSIASLPSAYRDYKDGQYMFNDGSCYYSIGDLINDGV